MKIVGFIAKRHQKNRETFCYDGINLYLCSNINNNCDAAEFGL